MLAVLGAYRERVGEERKFLAAIQGIDLDEENEDVSTFKDYQAEFGIGMGLGYETQGE